jgi:hypothetical protein
MSPFLEYLAISVKFVPRTYFAPLTGAIRGIREEYERIRKDEEAAFAEWERKHEKRASEDSPATR